MRAIHNTPIPDDSGDFPIPDDCSCEGISQELCDPCKQVIAEDLQQQEEEAEHYRKHYDQ